MLASLTLRAARRVPIASYASPARSFATGASSEPLDVAIIGGGIIGTATAREVLERNPKLKVGIFEKEDGLGLHQTSHNSGVIHAGMYYKPGSLKAKFCVEGMKRMYAYCDSKNIPYRKNGKLILAVKEHEKKGLRAILERGRQNGVPGLELIGPDAIRELEPNATGVEAVWSPETGIVDFQKVCFSYADDVRKAGGTITTGFKVKNLQPDSEGVDIHAEDGRSVRATHVITCAGLYSDKVAKSGGGGKGQPHIAPFRGAWLTVKEEYLDLVKCNIYPVPDPRLPWLGVHFTPTMKGEILLGPNATLAFQREGYRYRDINPVELAQTLTHPGVLKVFSTHLVSGIKEIYKDFVLSSQIARLQEYVPSITKDHIGGWKSGVRALAVNEDGILDEFVIEEGVPQRVINVRNAPSPACTASLRIAQGVVDSAEAAGFFK